MAKKKKVETTEMVEYWNIRTPEKTNVCDKATFEKMKSLWPAKFMGRVIEEEIEEPAPLSDDSQKVIDNAVEGSTNIITGDVDNLSVNDNK